MSLNHTLAPVLTVDSGSEVSFDLLDGGNNQFTASSTSSDVASFNFAQGDPAIGPVYTNGAEPDDVLKIEFLSLKTASYGWTAIFPGSAAFGLLADEFPEPALKIWDLETHADDGFAVFKDGIHIPINPFLGVVGLARGALGESSSTKAKRVGIFFCDKRHLPLLL
jgi:acetamidase/formamidase